MTNHNNTSRAAHAASATKAGFTTLDPGAGYVTTMNTYTVAPNVPRRCWSIWCVRLSRPCDTCPASSP